MENIENKETKETKKVSENKKPGKMNNLKYMREIYGATQEEIAERLDVSRVSISNWENGAGGRMSRVNQEKLSTLYGLGPEYFYEKEIDAESKAIILETKSKSRYAEQEFDMQKEEKLQSLFKTYSFKDAVENYMYSMKLVIALSDNCTLHELELAYKINEQMTRRLTNALETRKQDLEKGDEIQTLFKKLSMTTETSLF
jgi:transcriptional regulator with XRE-family HTH domain